MSMTTKKKTLGTHSQRRGKLEFQRQENSEKAKGQRSEQNVHIDLYEISGTLSEHKVKSISLTAPLSMTRWHPSIKIRVREMVFYQPDISHRCY